MEDNFSHPRQKAGTPVYNILPAVKPQVCLVRKLEQMWNHVLLSSLGWVATHLTSRPPLTGSWSCSGSVLPKHVSDFLRLLANSKVLTVEKKQHSLEGSSQCRALVQIYLLTQPEKSFKDIIKGINFYSSLWLRQVLAASQVLSVQKFMLKYQLPCSKGTCATSSNINLWKYLQAKLQGRDIREVDWGHIAHFHQLNKRKSNSLRRTMTSKFFPKSVFNTSTGSSPRLDW